MRRPESPDVLADGEWVRRGLTQVWQPAPRAPGLVACPVCLATLTEPCKTRNGFWTTHEQRLVTRRCGCGERPLAGSLFCSTRCRNDARAATYADRELRTPTRLRRRTAA